MRTHSLKSLIDSLWIHRSLSYLVPFFLYPFKSRTKSMIPSTAIAPVKMIVFIAIGGIIYPKVSPSF